MGHHCKEAGNVHDGNGRTLTWSAVCCEMELGRVGVVSILVDESRNIGLGIAAPFMTFIRSISGGSLAFRLLTIIGTSTFLLTAAPVAAHPLGNFTINHLTKISIARDRIAVRYVLDMAEIPTFSTLRAVSPKDSLSGPQLAAWGRSEAASLLPALRLASGVTIPIPLVLDRVATRTRPGAGGLPTLYLALDAHAILARPVSSLAYRDETFAGRLGWHDVVVAPRTEPTQELSAYPSALIGSPRSTTAVSLALANGAVVGVRGEEAVEGGTSAAAVPSAVRSNQLSDMLARGTSDWGFVALTFLVAIVLGGLHALEPGHGKTLLAVSLVGARATVKQAAILAGALTVATQSACSRSA